MRFVWVCGKQGSVFSEASAVQVKLVRWQEVSRGSKCGGGDRHGFGQREAFGDLPGAGWEGTGWRLSRSGAEGDPGCITKRPWRRSEEGVSPGGKWGEAWGASSEG